METRKIKIARVATVPFSLLGSRNVLKALSQNFDLQVICSEGKFHEEIQAVLDKPIINVEISREIKPFNDIIAVFKLFLILQNGHYDIVHSNTPKGGLICALAAFLARVPIRCHTFTGQRWATLKGLKKWMLMGADKIICMLNTHLYADSFSQISFLEKMNIPGKKQIHCLGQGGFAGIDINRFSKDKYSHRAPPDWHAPVKDKFKIGFVGRVVREKGIEILLDVFRRMHEEGLNVALVLIGPFEPHLDPIADEWLTFLTGNKDIIHTDFMTNPEEALVYCDLLCLPSFREGFPMVVLEAASMEIPSIVSRIPGNIDAVIENVTGLFFELDSPDQLKSAIEKYYYDKKLCEEMGKNARARVLEFFTDTYLQNEFKNEYLRIIGKHETTL